MLFSKRYDTKEVECQVCHKKVKPIIERNKLKSNVIGQRYSGLEKKYLLICPNCKAIISAKKINNHVFFYFVIPISASFSGKYLSVT